MFFGVIQKLYQIIIPFALRTAMIHFLGIKYLGLNGLFASILQVLNLIELGVGTAMIYSMYQPIAADDTPKICALLKLYKSYYTIIGGVITVIGLFIIPVVPKLITGDIPADINIYILSLINLAATVLSYWALAYKSSILIAHQRVDIISKISLVVNTVQYLLQFFALWIFRSFYLYVLITLVGQLATNLITAFVVSKMYPDYKAEGTLAKEERKEINGRIRDLFASKIGSVVYDSADTIVLSAFLGLTVLAVYQNYFYILSAITGFMSVIFTACTAGIGNSMVVETKEKNYRDLSKFTFIIFWIAGFASVCLLCLYQPFMELWVGKDLLLEFSAVICFVIYFFVRQLNSLLNLYKDAAGMWHEDKFRPLITALANLFLNLIFVRHIGIYGVLLSTILAILCIGMPWLLYNLFTVIFEKKYLKSYLAELFKYCIVVFLSCLITYIISSGISISSLIVTLIIRAAICILVPNSIYYFLYKNTVCYKESLILMNTMTKGKYKKYLEH